MTAKTDIQTLRRYIIELLRHVVTTLRLCRGTSIVPGKRAVGAYLVGVSTEKERFMQQEMHCNLDSSAKLLTAGHSSPDKHVR